MRTGWWSDPAHDRSRGAMRRMPRSQARRYVCATTGSNQSQHTIGTRLIAIRVLRAIECAGGRESVGKLGCR